MAAVLNRPLVRFLVVGGGAAALELLTFELLSPLPLLVAHGTSFLVGLVASFLGYRFWTFAGEHTLPLAAQFGSYATLALINVAATSGIIHLLVEAGLAPLVAKVVCMGLVATWNFLLLNRLVFRRTARSGEDAVTPDPAATPADRPTAA